jgi:hypothetical protein
MSALRFLSIACAVFAAALQAGVARAEIKTQWVEYKEGNTALRGYLAYDDAITGKRPGVLLAHDRAGMSEVALGDAAMIAKLGYVVFVGDIYGKDVLPKTIPEMTEQTVIYNKDRPLMRARATAGFDILKANPMVDASKIAVIGYCFGAPLVSSLRKPVCRSLASSRSTARSATSRPRPRRTSRAASSSSMAPRIRSRRSMRSTR